MLTLHSHVVILYAVPGLVDRLPVNKMAKFSLYPHNSKHCLASDPICHVSDFILQGLVRPQLFL